MHARASRSVRISHRSGRTLRTAAIAAVAVLPVTACSSGSSDEPTAPSTADTATAPTAAPRSTTTPGSPGGTTDAPGTGTSFFAGAEEVPVTFTLPTGWETEDVFVLKSEADPVFGLAFYDVANIYADGCQWVLVDPPVGPTVDDLVSAYANVPGFDTAVARSVTVDGFEGKQIEYTVPDYNEDECKGGKFALLREDGQPGSSDAPSLWAQGPNQHNQVWILDVDGTRLVILAGYHSDTSAQDRADLDEILNSIHIG